MVFTSSESGFGVGWLLISLAVVVGNQMAMEGLARRLVVISLKWNVHFSLYVISSAFLTPTQKCYPHLMKMVLERPAFLNRHAKWLAHGATPYIHFDSGSFWPLQASLFHSAFRIQTRMAFNDLNFYQCEIT